MNGIYFSLVMNNSNDLILVFVFSVFTFSQAFWLVKKCEGDMCVSKSLDKWR